MEKSFGFEKAPVDVAMTFFSGILNSGRLERYFSTTGMTYRIMRLKNAENLRDDTAY